MKGSEQPIWLLVAILLALVVGVAMYQLMGKANIEQFDAMIGGTDDGTARIALETFCRDWFETKWTAQPTGERKDKISDYAAKLGWLSKAEWENYEKFTACDCAVYLLSATDSRITREEVQGIYDRVKNSSDPEEKCHRQALIQANNNGIRNVRLPSN